MDKLNVQIELEQNQIVSTSILDLTGKVVVAEIQNPNRVGTNEISINVSDLHAGIYLLVVKYDGTTMTKKFLVQ